MATYVYRNGKVIEKHLAPPLITANSAPYVISDIMEPLRHMATNRMHTSKSKFRADTKASGCIEYGNDPALTRPRRPIPLSREKRREDIKKALYELRDGRRFDT